MTVLLETQPWLIWLVPAAPLAALAALPFDRDGRWLPLLGAVAALPALGAAVAGTNIEHEAGWLLFGARAGMDETARTFLLVAALLWGLASVHAQGYLHEGRRRFMFFWLVTMGGNFGVIVASDLVTFYSAFVAMTFAAYGLVVHDGSAFALRAGRVYIVMAVLGEVALLTGLLAAAWAAEGELGFAEVRNALATGPYRDAIIALLVAGLGVKAGLLFLHMWLPLAHPAAPVPASAVLSGAMIKAGLIGWLRFLPAGESSQETWGPALIALGLGGAFLAVLAGLPQRDPKVTLAYSSVSQIGIMAAIVGLGLASEAAAPAALMAATFYALHHGLAKGALFLGVSVVAAAGGPTRWIVFAGMALAAVAIAGAPLTSGMVAKGLIADVVDAGGDGRFVIALLPFTSIATTLLLGRFLLIVLTAPGAAGHGSRASFVAWATVTVAALFAAWVLPAGFLSGVNATEYVYAAAFRDAAWPLATGIAITAGATIWARQGTVRVPSIPPGDIVVPIERALSSAGAAWRWASPGRLLQVDVVAWWLYRHTFVFLFAGDRVERGLGNWTIAATLFVAIMLGLVVLG